MARKPATLKFKKFLFPEDNRHVIAHFESPPVHHQDRPRPHHGDEPRQLQQDRAMEVIGPTVATAKLVGPTAISRIAYELHKQALFYSKIEARQHNLFGDPEDRRTAAGIESVKRLLEEE